MSATSGGPFFDAQAATFRARAGLPARVRAEVAATIVEVGRLGPSRGVIDVGAGAGDIGLELAASGVDYVGLDASPAMLEQFRSDAARAGVYPRLVVADAGGPWPVAPGSAAVIFGSRSLHWLDPAHVATEAFTAASPEGALLVVGRVERDADSPRTRARRALRDLLAREGIQGRSGKRSSARLVEECVRRGASALPRRVVSSFGVRTSIRDAIEAFRGKPGLAGTAVDEPVKSRILDELRFTLEAFGNIDTAQDSVERYVLEGVTLIDGA